MKKSLWGVRVLLLGIYFFLTFPVLTYVGISLKLYAVWWVDTYCVHAIPLYLAHLVDVAFYDGSELSPGFIPLWVVFTGVLLWPLLFLAMEYDRLWCGVARWNGLGSVSDSPAQIFGHVVYIDVVEILHYMNHLAVGVRERPFFCVMVRYQEGGSRTAPTSVLANCGFYGVPTYVLFIHDTHRVCYSLIIHAIQGNNRGLWNFKKFSRNTGAMIRFVRCSWKG